MSASPPTASRARARKASTLAAAGASPSRKSLHSGTRGERCGTPGGRAGRLAPGSGGAWCPVMPDYSMRRENIKERYVSYIGPRAGGKQDLSGSFPTPRGRFFAFGVQMQNESICCRSPRAAKIGPPPTTAGRPSSRTPYRMNNFAHSRTRIRGRPTQALGRRAGAIDRRMLQEALKKKP